MNFLDITVEDASEHFDLKLTESDDAVELFETDFNIDVEFNSSFDIEEDGEDISISTYFFDANDKRYFIIEVSGDFGTDSTGFEVLSE